jgi:hypothetical protein
LYVLESNNPCYFASGQLAIGTDVSGAMVEHLLQKSKRLTGDVPAVLKSRIPAVFEPGEGSL